MPSLNFIFRDLDMAAMHLSTIIRTLPGSGLHWIVYYFEGDKINRGKDYGDFITINSVKLT